MRYECFNCEKEFDEVENGMCSYCHSDNFIDKGTGLNNWKDMVFPCCKKNLPASLDGVAIATCSCGMQYLPKVIADYNEMLNIIIGWRSVVNDKAQIICKEGEGTFVANLIRRGVRFIL